MKKKTLGEVTIYLADCAEILPTLDKVDLCLTSPPYDELRTYGGQYRWDFEKTAVGIKNVLLPGGVCAWIVGDSVVKGSESGTAFRQALYFKSLGLRLHDTMIYCKNAFPFFDKTRYAQVFEYMFVFSNGKPKTTNIQRVQIRPSHRSKSTYRAKDGSMISTKYVIGEKPERNRENVWVYDVGFVGTAKDKIAYQHPAIFPEKLVADHVRSWTNEGDLVLDPMMGSGTTGVVCLQTGRKFIGVEVNPEYFDLAWKRLQKAYSDLGFFRR